MLHIEFGNLKDSIYLLIPFFILLIVVIGTVKKFRILSLLKLKKKTGKESFKGFCFIAGTLLAVIALLSPQQLDQEEKVKVEGSSIYFLIDTSRSMLTEDVYPNRIEAAKRAMNNVLDNLKGDRIGFIPYSDSAYVQMPLTDDYSMAKNFINAIDTNLISGGGTQLLEGLKMAEKSFKESGTADKAVLILSDGGDLEEETLKFAKDNNIKIFSLGIGTEQGAVIPYKDNSGNAGFIKDDKGNVVISGLNSSFLKKLSAETKGKYFEMNNLQDNSKTIAEELHKRDKSETREESLKIYKKFYQLPLLIGMILIIIGRML